MKRASLTIGLLWFGICAPGGAEYTPGGGKALGDPKARVRIELYSDFQCPSCKALHEQVVAPLIEDYVKSGKVYLVHREFPLPIHAYAREAACYACAAAKIGKYQEVCDQLFRTQPQWSKDGNVSAAACQLLSAADAGKMRSLAGSKEIAGMIEEDIRAGQSQSVNSTPSLIISNTRNRTSKTT